MESPDTSEPNDEFRSDSHVSDVNIEVPIYTAEMPPHLETGVFANRASHIIGEDIVFLDFSMVSPRLIVVEGNIEPKIAHKVVSRVVMPVNMFEDFIQRYVARNARMLPDIIAAIESESEMDE